MKSRNPLTFAYGAAASFLATYSLTSQWIYNISFYVKKEKVRLFPENWFLTGPEDDAAAVLYAGGFLYCFFLAGWLFVRSRKAGFGPWPPLRASIRSFVVVAVLLSPLWVLGVFFATVASRSMPYDDAWAQIACLTGVGAVHAALLALAVPGGKCYGADPL